MSNFEPQDDADAWISKGISLARLDRFAEAIQCYYKALEINPKSAEAWYNKGVVLNSLGCFNEAIGCYYKALEINPQNANAWYCKGVSLISLGCINDAINCLDKALEINPQRAEAWATKAYAENELGKVDEALSCCRRALEIDSKLKGARDLLVVIYYKKGDYEALVTCSQETLRLTPEDLKARIMLSEALALSNKLADAEAEAQKALETVYAADYAKAEDLSVIYQQLGILSVMRGHERALEYFEKAIKANQRDQWMYKVADAYLLLNMMGSLMEGTPQERRARLLGLAKARECSDSYRSYLQWKENSVL
jgi:tetratricopeptide (TPR) repeat protein